MGARHAMACGVAVLALLGACSDDDDGDEPEASASFDLIAFCDERASISDDELRAHAELAGDDDAELAAAIEAYADDRDDVAANELIDATCAGDRNRQNDAG